MPPRKSLRFCANCVTWASKDEFVRTALELKKEGKYDPDSVPDFIREAVEEAEEMGEYDE